MQQASYTYEPNGLKAEEKKPTVAEQVLSLTDGLIIDGLPFYSERHMFEFGQQRVDELQKYYSEERKGLNERLSEYARTIEGLRADLETEKAKPATLAEKPVTKETLEAMLANVAKNAPGCDIQGAQIKFLKQLIYEFERKVMATPLPKVLAEKDREISDLMDELNNRGRQIQYLASNRDEYKSAYEHYHSSYKKLEEQETVNTEIQERVRKENDDLYGFVCEVARLKKIPEGAYIVKEEGEALNAAITHAKALHRKYD
jgi:chromosome segregation ATPase